MLLIITFIKLCEFSSCRKQNNQLKQVNTKPFYMAYFHNGIGLNFRMLLIAICYDTWLSLSMNADLDLDIHLFQKWISPHWQWRRWNVFNHAGQFQSMRQLTRASLVWGRARGRCRITRGSPLEAESFWAYWRQKEMANLSTSLLFQARASIGFQLSLFVWLLQCLVNNVIQVVFKVIYYRPSIHALVLKSVRPIRHTNYASPLLIRPADTGWAKKLRTVFIAITLCTLDHFWHTYTRGNLQPEY